MYVLTRAEMQEADRITIAELGVPGALLMESAGGAVARHVADFAGTSGGRGFSVLVVAGAGNNAGDGFVAARHLIDVATRVDVALLLPAEQLTGDARDNLERLKSFPVAVHDCSTPGALDDLALLTDQADVVVDAVFGTGLTRAIQGHLFHALELVGRRARHVVAVDLPSGVDADTGRIHGIALKAEVTVTFALPKQGHFLFPGRELVGRLFVEPMGIPAGLAPRLKARGRLLSDRDVAPFFGPRAPDSHKKDHGHLFVAAGSPGKAGAALLACTAAARVGAGLVTLLTDDQTRCSLQGLRPDLMVETLGREERSRADAWVAGCGMGTDAAAQAFLEGLLAEAQAPVVLDADALTLLARHPALLGQSAARVPLVLTPHPAEMRRFPSLPEALAEDPVAALRQFATGHGVTVLLKGATTLVAAPDGRVWFNVVGSPAMATAGSGDVLAGLIGGMLVQDKGRHLAAEVTAAAVTLHGRLGERLEAEFGQRGATAADYERVLPEVVRAFERLE
jgi:NAD(P)H-hydrate epimerase